MINLMLRYNSDISKLEYSTNAGTSWTELDITGMNMNLTKVDGVALGTHGSSYVPGDIREVDGVALTAHAAGKMPADVLMVAGSLINALISGRVDCSIGAVASGAFAGKLFKSIQYGTVTFTSTTGGTATLSPTVVAANSVLIFLGAELNQTDALNGLSTAVRITLTNGSTVTATRLGSASMVVSFCVLEFP